MIIPVRCYTCNKHIGNLWEPYINMINDKKNISKSNDSNIDVEYLDTTSLDVQKSIEGRVLDDLKLNRYCCRRMMLTNVHIITNL